MIGTEQGVSAMWCDLCRRPAKGVVFTGQKAIDKYIKTNGWVQFTTDKDAPQSGMVREICAECVASIVAGHKANTPTEEPPPKKKRKPATKRKKPTADDTDAAPTVPDDDTGGDDNQNDTGGTDG